MERGSEPWSHGSERHKSWNDALGIFTIDHLRALRRGVMARWHLQGFRNADYFLLFSWKLIQHALHG